MDVSQYLEIFLDESKEHLQNLNTQILELEQDSENMDTINEIFRAAHSLKGMAGTMGYKRMQNLTHDMEDVFSEVRNGAIKVKPEMIDILFQCLDALEEYVNNIQESADEGTNDNEPIIKALAEIRNGASGGAAPAADKLKDEAPKADATAEAPAAAPAASSNEKWREIKLTDTEKSLYDAAKAEGKKFYGIDVKVQESCLLKAARAFLVFKALEDHGEIIISQPSSQDIEDEKFENEFSVIVVSGDPIDEILRSVKAVSEIEDATGTELTDSDFAGVEASEEKDEAPAKGEKAEETAPAVVASADKKAAPAKAAEKKSAAKPVVNRTVRVDIEKLDSLMNLVSELIIAKNSLVSSATSSSESDSRNNNFQEQIEYLESVTTSLHESVMKVRMVPIESVVSKFPRMIRDLQKSLGKKMELYMTGEETELDRTVVDEIGDPLMHLLRNAADHGIESDANLRIQRGKPEAGSIFLDAYQDGNNVIIEVRDDGNGIDVDKVREKAIERGTITAEQAEGMTDKEITNLLFLPSFSTAKQISEISGRGVGLDVVKSKIEALSGEVEVKSKLGEGSTWIVRLPLTLAIIQALMVVVGNEKYAISLGSIQTIEDIPAKDIQLVQSKEVITLRGNVIPIVRLNDVLDIESTKSADENLMVIIVKKGDKLAGLVVDELIGQQEIVIKSMGKYITKSKLISGATILGDGEVALILDANALI
ncbi:MAG: chemotaxis protein CheA [Lachnospiraceae bacterium]|nr:chemotaxis protein CheA [Lachnospiraceae bacterium]